MLISFQPPKRETSTCQSTHLRHAHLRQAAAAAAAAAAALQRHVRHVRLWQRYQRYRLETLEPPERQAAYRSGLHCRWVSNRRLLCKVHTP